jgi:hypothetical protein
MIGGIITDKNGAVGVCVVYVQTVAAVTQWFINNRQSPKTVK